MEHAQQKEIQRLERLICRKRNILKSNTNPYGDWRGIKYREYVDSGRPAPYTKAEMEDYYQQREQLRRDISEAQTQLAVLRGAES